MKLIRVCLSGHDGVSWRQHERVVHDECVVARHTHHLKVTRRVFLDILGVVAEFGYDSRKKIEFRFSFFRGGGFGWRLAGCGGPRFDRR